jgi:paraquat-inducible protein A
MGERLMCCHECDELCRIENPEKIGIFKCPNCGHTLFRHRPGMIEKMFALSLAALVLFGVTIYFPFMSFQVAGNVSQINFITGIVYLFKEHDWLLGLAVLMTTVVVPLQRIVLFLTLFGPLYFGRLPFYAVSSLKALAHSTPWGMIDVFLVGVLVSLVKLLKMGTVTAGTSLWAFGVLVFVMAAMQATFNPHQIWEMVDEARSRK